MGRLLKIAAVLGVLAALATGAVIAVTLLRADDAGLRTAAPEIPAGADVSPTAAPAGSSGALRFVIDQAGSEVKYVVRETLRGVVGVNAVGTTNAISGDLYLTRQGLAPGGQSKFSVDLRQLKTDESLRDNFVRQNVLQTTRFPTADFVADAISGFPANYTEGQEVPMTLKGQLTIHGVTRSVEWEVKARQAGDTLTGIANLSFNMTDFGITPPTVPLAKAEDGVQLQVTIVARRAA